MAPHLRTAGHACASDGALWRALREELLRNWGQAGVRRPRQELALQKESFWLFFGFIDFFGFFVCWFGSIWFGLEQFGVQ